MTWQRTNSRQTILPFGTRGLNINKLFKNIAIDCLSIFNLDYFTGLIQLSRDILVIM